MKRIKTLLVFLALALLFGLAACGGGDEEEARRVTARFVNYDGAVLYETQIDAGSTPVYEGATPVRPSASSSVRYEFCGWETGGTVYTELFAIEEDTVFTASYTEQSTVYTVTFDVDGEPYTVRVSEGGVPRFYGTPYRPATAEQTWTFVGWRKGEEVFTVLPATTGDVTYYAEFRAVPRSVHVAFKDRDGTDLFETDVEYGETPAYGGKALGAEGGMYDLVFRAWDLDGTEYAALPAAYEDCVFTALYTRAARTYTLTVSYFDGDVKVGSYTDVLPAGDDYAVSSPVRTGKAADRPVVAGVLTENTEVTVRYSAVSVWDGSVASAFAEGSGAAASPYVISSGAELAYLAQQSQSDAFTGKYFTLNCNIDLAEKPWAPIGCNARPFAGVFDGNGHSVVGLNRNSTAADATANYGNGLFSASSGTVKNLTVSGTVSSVPRYSALVVGYNNFGKVENCTAYGSSTGYGNVGGVVGYSKGDVTGCVNYAEVHDNGNTASYRIGGVVGTITDGGSVRNCENRGAVLVRAGTGRVGGIIGHIEGTGTVEDCTNYGYVLYDKQIAASAMTYTGGCVGISSVSLVARCENYGVVEGADRIGGVLGWTRETRAEDCKNFGTVLGTTYVGGVVGVSRSTITGCENHGTVRASAAYCGGVVASLLGSASNCTNYVDLYSAGSSFGGIVGSLGTEAGMKEARLTSCTNYGILRSSCTTANVTTGGIAGRSDSIVDSNIYAIVEACENYGKVVASGSYTGGIIGACNGAKIEGCTNRATVCGGIGAYVGGIAGSNYGYGTVMGCKNYGTVLGASTVGGICGQLTSTSTATGNFDGGKTLLGK